MSDQPGPGPKNGFVAQIIGNTSLLAAMLIYTGWAYENALLGYFSLTPLALNLSNLNYILKGTFLFIPNIIFLVVLLVLVVVFFSKAPSLASSVRRRFVKGQDAPIREAGDKGKRQSKMAGLGLFITVTAGFLAWFGLHNNGITSHPAFLYLAIVLLGAGSIAVSLADPLSWLWLLPLSARGCYRGFVCRVGHRSIRQ
jgi:hypothetical protein